MHEQIVKKQKKLGFEFNIMVAGESSTIQHKRESLRGRLSTILTHYIFITPSHLNAGI